MDSITGVRTSEEVEKNIRWVIDESEKIFGMMSFETQRLFDGLKQHWFSKNAVEFGMGPGKKMFEVIMTSQLRIAGMCQKIMDAYNFHATANNIEPLNISEVSEENTETKKRKRIIKKEEK